MHGRQWACASLDHLDHVYFPCDAAPYALRTMLTERKKRQHFEKASWDDLGFVVALPPYCPDRGMKSRRCWTVIFACLFPEICKLL